MRSSPGLRAAVFAIVLFLTACPGAEPTTPRASTTGEAEEPRRGGALNVVLSADIDSLDPHLAARPSSWFFARAIHRGLLAYPAAAAPAGAEPVPDLARAVPRRSGGRWVFALRPGVVFANGDPVTASDVARSIDRLRTTGRGVSAYLRGVRARALDGTRVEIRGGSADLPWILAHPQAAIVPADTPAFGSIAPDRIVGAGPYRVASYAPERRLVLERQREWSVRTDPVRGAYVDEIDARLGVRRPAAEKSVRDGDADLVVDPGPPDAFVPARPKGRTVTVASSCVRALFLNTTVKPFNDSRVRRAIASSVARARLPGVGSVATAAVRMLPPVVTGHRAEPVLREDVAAARRLLAAAGRTSLRAELTVADAPRDQAEASAIRTALRRAGIRLAVRTVPPALLYADRYESPSARVAMGVVSWCAEWPGLSGRALLDPLFRSSSSRTTRFSGIRSSSLDAALSRARRDGGRWDEADRAATSSGAMIPLTWPNEVGLLSARVRGWSGAPMFPRGDPATLWLT